MAKASGRMGRREGTLRGGDRAPQRSSRARPQTRVAVEGEKTSAPRFHDKSANQNFTGLVIRRVPSLLSSMSFFAI